MRWHNASNRRASMMVAGLALLASGCLDAEENEPVGRAGGVAKVAKSSRESIAHAPRPLSPNAVTADWPTFLGPSHDGTTPEAPLLTRFPPGGLKKVWELEIGSGYASPAIVGDRLILFHRIAGEEIVDCLSRKTGAPLWRYAYPSQYEDRYQFSNGPRGSPTIDGECVYTLGAEGVLHCLDLATGQVRWHTDIVKAYKLKQNFFGVGATPLVEGDVLIVLVGAPGGPCVVGLDKRSGKERWHAGDGWSAGYASPVSATIYGERRLLMFTGGDSEPPDGGLLSIDPKTGAIALRVPFRSKNYTSVNATNPVVVGHQVFLTSSYKTGGALVNIRPDVGYDIAWKNNHLKSQFPTPIHHKGHLYGVDEINSHNCGIVCVELSTGRQLWRVIPEWEETIIRDGKPEQKTVGAGRATLTRADGRFLLLGEEGQLAWLNLSPEGYKELSKTRLFDAAHTWTPPAISRGLLYVRQNMIDRSTKAAPRLICYDFRG